VARVAGHRVISNIEKGFAYEADWRARESCEIVDQLKDAEAKSLQAFSGASEFWVGWFLPVCGEG
jgi:hypothetical protein